MVVENVTVKRGVLMLQPENIATLGGKVIWNLECVSISIRAYRHIDVWAGVQQGKLTQRKHYILLTFCAGHLPRLSKWLLHLQ